MKTIKVITTVGTSLVENAKKGKYLNQVDDEYGCIKKAEYYQSWKSYFENGTVDTVKGAIRPFFEKSYADISAEIKSLVLIQAQENCKLEVYLICTDTILSVVAAEMIKEYFRKIDANEEKFDIRFEHDEEFILKGLQVDDAKLFRTKGIENLIKVFQSITYNRDFSEYTILNITGGYKALIPYLTILGQINSIRIFYVFEDTNELILFPQAPIDINFGIFQHYYSVFSNLNSSLKEENWENYKRINDLPFSIENFIEKEDIIDGNSLFSLNAVGKYYFEIFENYYLIEIVKGSGIFTDSEGNRQQVTNSVREIFERLQEVLKNNSISDEKQLIDFINSNDGEKYDLKHGQNPQPNMFIFKSTNQEQIRVVYSLRYSNGYLSLKIYDYLRGGANFNHSQYIQDFKNKFRFKNEFDFVRIPIKKS